MRFERLSESLKYFTVLFYMKVNFFKYIKSVIIYKIKREAKFPKSIIKLKNVKFETREDSMDIAHLSNLYERNTTNMLMNLNPGIFIDVGTHIGRYSLILANKKWKVISIEPSKENFEQLKRNIKINKLEERITAINFGCFDKNEKKILYFVPHNEGLTSLEKKKNSREEIVQLEKLDDICNNINLKPESINAIKIDVEGFELSVLRGALNILKKSSPILIIEITEKDKEVEIKKFLREFGFINNKVLDSRNFIFLKDKI